MISDILLNTDNKMSKTLDVLKRELRTIRTGHASPALVENVKVDYQGTPLPLNQLASISAPEAKLIVIHPWDRSTLTSIEKAILKSDLGLNPINDGNVIRLPIPPLTEERRKELVKVVAKKVEGGRIAIRNLRRQALDSMRQLEKNKEISQDEYERAQEQLQKLTDRAIVEANQIGQSKEAELLEV